MTTEKNQALAIVPELDLPAPGGNIQSQGRGLYRDVATLTEAFKVAAQRFNLLAPITRVDYIPPLHAVSLRIIVANPLPARGDVYPIEGKFALLGSTLDRIAAAAGISWYVPFCGRMDDASNPHYCRYRAVGWMIDIDGARRDLPPGERETDLRDGSTLASGMKPRELDQARKFIVPLTESKAKNRVIRHGLAIKSAYTSEDLAKPFVIPKLVFTGETDDPELRRMIAGKIADRALAASDSLYGPSTPTRETAFADPVLGTLAPPPVGATTDTDDGEGDCGCPDGPGGIHLEGCARGKAAELDI